MASPSVRTSLLTVVPIPDGTFLGDLEVTGRTEVARDVVSIVPAAPDGSELPAWTPGADIDPLLTPELTRQYLLCGSAADRTCWRICVLRDPLSRGGSRYIREELGLNAWVPVCGPRNNFPLVEASAYVFLAGGIGITPLLAMTAPAEIAGARWALFYGRRTRSSLGFMNELAPYRDWIIFGPENERGMLDLNVILGQPSAGELRLRLRSGRTAAGPRGPEFGLARRLPAHRTLRRQAGDRRGDDVIRGVLPAIRCDRARRQIDPRSGPGVWVPSARSRCSRLVLDL